MLILTASWVFPIDAPPIADGAVAIRGGSIAGVGKRREVLLAFPGAERWDLSDAAILPGLVNCHTHLELSALSPVPAERSFAAWLVRLIERRRESGVPCLDAALAGGRALLASGTTCVGDVSAVGESLTALGALGLRGVVYREVLGLSPDEAASRIGAAAEDLRRMLGSASEETRRVGLSPHSPYGLSEELFRACGALLRRRRMPCCIHAAESSEEQEFLSTGGGPIATTLYPAVGCSLAPPRQRAESSVAYLDSLGALAWRPLLIHAVHVDSEDIRRMARTHVTVAHCPRSNALLSGRVAPVAEFLRHGVPVGLGTDSLASAPTLDLWDEMRAVGVGQVGRIMPREILEMATLGGARALGLAGEIGSLTVGKRADVIAVSARLRTADPIAALVAATRGEDVLLSLVDGEVRHRRLAEVPCG